MLVVVLIRPCIAADLTLTLGEGTLTRLIAALQPAGSAITINRFEIPCLACVPVCDFKQRLEIPNAPPGFYDPAFTGVPFSAHWFEQSFMAPTCSRVCGVLSARKCTIPIGSVAFKWRLINPSVKISRAGGAVLQGGLYVTADIDGATVTAIVPFIRALSLQYSTSGGSIKLGVANDPVDVAVVSMGEVRHLGVVSLANDIALTLPLTAPSGVLGFQHAAAKVVIASVAANDGHWLVSGNLVFE